MGYVYVVIKGCGYGDHDVIGVYRTYEKSLSVVNSYIDDTWNKSDRSKGYFDIWMDAKMMDWVMVEKHTLL